MKKIFIFAMACCLLVGCFPTAMADSAFSAALDMTKWQYNASDDVYTDRRARILDGLQAEDVLAPFLAHARQ